MLYLEQLNWGDGRNLDSKIFIDMLIGRDNYLSTDINKENEPGNQLGGLDFNYLFLKNKNLSFYGQIAGEDESGYLPSKTFYSIGMSLSWDWFYLKKINFEYIDTGSRQMNTTYNHSIYKNGYRYLGPNLINISWNIRYHFQCYRNWALIII